MNESASYIIAARRSANGRIGGIHRQRRIEQLASPIIEGALADAKIEPANVDEVIIGNTTNGGENPARLISLASGLPENIPAFTIDRQCASGLEAILTAMRLIKTSQADIVVAGGAEAHSMAPWRIAKPRSLYHPPKFSQNNPLMPTDESEVSMADVAEALAKRTGISREQQDAFAFKSHMKANLAEDKRHFLNEIVPMRIDATETRDEMLRSDISLEMLNHMPALFAHDGTVSQSNSAPVTDGASIVIIVSQKIYEDLGKPPALKVLGGMASGTASDQLGLSIVPAIHKVLENIATITLNDIDLVEINEAFSVQVLAAINALQIDDDKINKDGGAIALGHTLAASSSLLVTRLFSRMVRNRDELSEQSNIGMATLCASGGVGIAAIFEAV